MVASTFKLIHQSPWIGGFYEFLSFDKIKGVLAEIGVGNVISYPGRDELQRRNVKHVPFEYELVGSNSVELLEAGWFGILVDPIKEYLDQARVVHRSRLDRVRFVNNGASDVDRFLEINDNESFISGTKNDTSACYFGRRLQLVRTQKIFDHFGIRHLDLLSVDAEGMDHLVLQGIDFDKVSVDMIVVEISHVGRAAIRERLPGYFLEARFDELNAVYLNKRLIAR